MISRTALQRPFIRRSFTLLELVLVLAILAIASAVAIRSVEGMRGQRQDTLMDDISDAIYLKTRDAGGSINISGFAADIGRLPRAVGSDPATQLRELWENPNDLYPNTMQTATNDPEVRVPCGWRSNYLILPRGESRLLDAWGRPFQLFNAEGHPAMNGDSIVTIRSLGANGVIDTSNDDDENADDQLDFTTDGFVSITVTLINTNAMINMNSTGCENCDETKHTVWYFGPDPLTGRLVPQRFEAASTGSPVFIFDRATRGVRVIRAYQLTSDEEDSPAAPPQNCCAKSVPLRIAITGAESRELVIRNVTTCGPEPDETDESR